MGNPNKENNNGEEKNNRSRCENWTQEEKHLMKKPKTAINNSVAENEEDDRLVCENDNHQIHGIRSSSRDCERGINDYDYDFEIDSGQTSTNSEPPVIYVFAVDPELDLEDTSEEEDCHINQNENEEVEPVRSESDENENVIQTSTQTYDENGATDHVEEQQKNDILDLLFEMPAIINVDDFFIKENNIAVVSNADEYLIKNSKNMENKNEENPDNFFINGNKKSSAIVSQQHQTCSIPRDVQKESLNKEEEAASFDYTPHKLDEKARIDEIKRFLMEDLPDAKGNTEAVHRSCPLPHSPACISYMNVDDERTTFSFQDLNINDLPELNFDDGTIDKNLAEVNSENDYVLQTLTDEDIKEFIIPNKSIETVKSNAKYDVDAFNELDLDLEAPVNSVISYLSTANDTPTTKLKIQSRHSPSDKQKPILKNITTDVTTNIPNLLSYHISKSHRPIKTKLNTDTKGDADDYVNVESFNETTSISVLETNNLSSLLEQFEVTEKLNNSDSRLSKRDSIKVTNPLPKNKITNDLTSGTRLQDATMQLNKNNMWQMLISTTSPKCTVPKKSDVAIHSDHYYCSPKKHRNINTSIKKRRSLLKPKVLSSNDRIWKSRHRTCKNKKIIYYLSSDDETDNSVSNNKNKICVKANAKTPLQSNYKKKLSPVYSVPSVSVKCDSNGSMISHTASKARDNSSQGSNGSIKLTIKNKSKVILNLNCDSKKDSLKHENSNKYIKIKDSSIKIVPKNKKNIEKNKKTSPICTSEVKNVNVENSTESLVIKEETRPIKQKSKDFYMTLFDNKKDLKISFDTSIPNKEINEKTLSMPAIVSQQITPEMKQRTKKKISLQEYKLRKEVPSSNSRTVNPEAIFPDIPKVAVPKVREPTVIESEPEKSNKISNLMLNANFETLSLKTELIKHSINKNDSQKSELEPPKKMFDPISEASRKILMNKKQKVEAMRKRDEDIVMSRIPKIKIYEPQPLAEILNIAEKIPEVTPPTPFVTIGPKLLDEKTLSMPEITLETKQPTKKKISLQEYKLRKEVGSSNSRTVNPEGIFPDIPKVAVPKVREPTVIESEPEKSNNISNLMLNANFETLSLKTELIEHSINKNDSQKSELEPPKKMFDPISEASRNILMNKKQKAEAMRKRDEDIVMSRIPKIKIYEPQPLAEILNIAEKIPEVNPPTPFVTIGPKLLHEKTWSMPEIVSQQITLETKQPTKKKISLQEYKLRKEVGSSNSRTVNPEAIFPDIPKVAVPKVREPTVIESEPEKSNNISNLMLNANFETLSLKTELIEHSINKNDSQKSELEPPKKIFDPISEASRKILMNKKQKAEAMRKRDEDIVMSRIPKSKIYEPQPLAEILNIAENIPEVTPPTPFVTIGPKLLYEKTLSMPEIVSQQITLETKQPTKKKISLQEYKLRKEVVSSNSRTLNPEAIFPDIPKVAVPKIYEAIKSNSLIIKSEPEKGNNVSNLTQNANFETLSLKTELIEHLIDMNDSQKSELEPPKKIFDPISEASKKILMNKKQKAEAMRKRHEDIVMSRIPKIKIYEPQPLAKILNIAENIPEVTPPTPFVTIGSKLLDEKTLSMPEIVLQQITLETKQPTKKKISLQEYKLRKKVASSNSRTVNPEEIFPDIPKVAVPKIYEAIKSNSLKIKSEPEKGNNISNLTQNANFKTLSLKTELIEHLIDMKDSQKSELEPPKKIFDPISEASRKILMNKKQKAEAMRKQDEDIVLSKIPKIENYEPQPLAEILNIAEEIPEVTPRVAISLGLILSDYEEIVMVNVGVNTDPAIFNMLEPIINNSKKEGIERKKIKKSDNVLKHNVLRNEKQDKKSPQQNTNTKRQSSPCTSKELKIDNERYKNITKTLKHVERNFEAKISSNSLLSIRDVVKKSKIDKNNKKIVHLKEAGSKSDNEVSVNNNNREHNGDFSRVTIVRDYEKSKEHGEDKVIVHLYKTRVKPIVNNISVQTDKLENIIDVRQNHKQVTTSVPETTSEFTKTRKKRKSDMSLSSECSPVRDVNINKPENATLITKSNEKVRHVQDYQVKPKERSRRDSRKSPCHYDSKSYRGRSQSKNRSSKASKSRSSRSRSSSYKSRQRTKSRSKSHSKSTHRRWKSPIPKKAKSCPSNSEIKPEVPKKVENVTAPHRKRDTSMTPPPIRNTTVSECFESSTSSSTSSYSSSTSESSTSSSSVSSSDRSSVKRRYSLSLDNSKKSNLRKHRKVNELCTRLYSCDSRDYCASVEERKIVLVGKLEKDITKSALKNKFSPLGPIMEVTLHSKEDGLVGLPYESSNTALAPSQITSQNEQQLQSSLRTTVSPLPSPPSSPPVPSPSYTSSSPSLPSTCLSPWRTPELSRFGISFTLSPPRTPSSSPRPAFPPISMRFPPSTPDWPPLPFLLLPPPPTLSSPPPPPTWSSQSRQRTARSTGTLREDPITSENISYNTHAPQKLLRRSACRTEFKTDSKSRISELIQLCNKRILKVTLQRIDRTPPRRHLTRKYSFIKSVKK